MFNNGSNVSATIIYEKGVGKPTSACLILTTSVSNVDDDSCKACKLTLMYSYIDSVQENS